MKLNEPKVEIISRGTDPSVDFTFSDNFCPCCGTNCQKVKIEKFTKDGLLFTYHGRKATIKCPSCGTVFQKEICDNKELLTSVSDTIFLHSVIILALSALSFIFFCFFNITIGYVISLIILIISFICASAASD